MHRRAAVMTLPTATALEARLGARVGRVPHNFHCGDYSPYGDHFPTLCDSRSNPLLVCGVAGARMQLDELKSKTA
jgi:hypothetical protein